MAKSRNVDFRRKLARQIEPTGGPRALLEILEDAARFIGLMKRWRQARPYWDHCAGEILKAAETSRAGRLRIARLLEQYGPDIATPDLRHELAQCPRRLDMSDPCQIEYVDRLADF